MIRTLLTIALLAGAATAPDGSVVFAPHLFPAVGIFDAVLREFWYVDLTETMNVNKPLFHNGQNQFCGATTTLEGLVVCNLRIKP